MIINASGMAGLFTGFSTAFRNGFAGAPSAYRDVAMIVPSHAQEENYSWLDEFPRMREWIGDRIIKNLKVSGYTVTNRDFEQTVGVPRNKIMDDQYGTFGPRFEEMGRSAAELPDELVFGLLKLGFSTRCYDGQYFFDTDHPVSAVEGGEPASVSNVQAGSGSPWFLLDTSRPIKPLIYQERMPLNVLVAKDQPDDDNVFWQKQFIYGSDGRCNAGFGLWQLAFGSKAPLTVENYEAARKFMQTQKGNTGRPLGVLPDTLVISPDLESEALDILNSATLANGAANKWKGTAKVIKTPWVL